MIRLLLHKREINTSLIAGERGRERLREKREREREIKKSMIERDGRERKRE